MGIGEQVQGEKSRLLTHNSRPSSTDKKPQGNFKYDINAALSVLEVLRGSKDGEEAGEQQLRKAREFVNSRRTQQDKGGETLLHAAAWIGDLEATKRLVIEWKADPSMETIREDAKGRTAKGMAEAGKEKEETKVQPNEDR